MPATIELSDIHFSYDSPEGIVDVMRSLSLKVHPGEYVALVGPSGCGKSTILRLLAGTLRLLGDGSIRSGTLHLAGANPQDQIRASLLPQTHALLPWRSVLQNVLLPFQLQGVAITAAHQAHAMALLDELAISDFASYYPRQLSGGIAQRAALARALAPDADLLLLDEPLNAVDVAEKERIQPSLRQIIKSSGTTVLHVTHDLYEAAFVADRVLVLSDKPTRVLASIPLPDGDRTDAFRASQAYLNAVTEIRNKLSPPITDAFRNP